MPEAFQPRMLQRPRAGARLDVAARIDHVADDRGRDLRVTVQPAPSAPRSCLVNANGTVARPLPRNTSSLELIVNPRTADLDRRDRDRDASPRAAERRQHAAARDRPLVGQRQPDICDGRLHRDRERRELAQVDAAQARTRSRIPGRPCSTRGCDCCRPAGTDRGRCRWSSHRRSRRWSCNRLATLYSSGLARPRFCLSMLAQRLVNQRQAAGEQRRGRAGPADRDPRARGSRLRHSFAEQ